VLTPGNELLADWAEALAAGQTIAPFHDLYLAPVTVDLVAKLAIRIAGERAGGIFQCAGAEDRNYVDLARILLAEHGGDEDLIQPISRRDTNMPAAAGPRHTPLEMSVEQNFWGIAAPEFGATARAVILAGNASPA
jgi:dTDP-4-dehydrorhamnose reductase